MPFLHRYYRVVRWLVAGLEGKNVYALTPIPTQISLTYRLSRQTSHFITGAREWSSILWDAVISHPSMSNHPWENGQYCSTTTQDDDSWWKYFSFFVNGPSKTYHETRQFIEIIIIYGDNNVILNKVWQIH